MNWAAFESLPNVSSVMVLLSWILVSAYVFSLPLIARTANLAYYSNPDGFGNVGPLCNLPVSTPGLECINGDNLTELAALENRTTICGCQQGLFGETLCPIHPGGFSISHYISASVGTGAMGSISIMPNSMMWWYQEWIEFELQPRRELVSWSFWSLFAFQVMYCMFFACTTCLDYVSHVTTVSGWFFAGCIHWAVIAKICQECKFQKGAQIITVFLAVGAGLLFPVAAANTVPCSVFYFGCTHSFWLMECVLMVVGYGITPILVFVAGLQLPVPRKLIDERRKLRGY